MPKRLTNGFKRYKERISLHEYRPVEIIPATLEGLEREERGKEGVDKHNS